MKYEFILENGRSLPIFINEIGINNAPMNVCLDTACGLTTFYMGYDLVKTLYPNIKRTGDTVDFINANGKRDRQSIYVIPEFILTDNAKNTLHIRDFYCSIVDINMSKIDILLSGDVFYNTKISVTPKRDKETKEAYRAFLVNTFGKKRNTLFMQKQVSNNGLSYIGALKVPNP